MNADLPDPVPVSPEPECNCPEFNNCGVHGCPVCWPIESSRSAAERAIRRAKQPGRWHR